MAFTEVIVENPKVLHGFTTGLSSSTLTSVCGDTIISRVKEVVESEEVLAAANTDAIPVVGIVSLQPSIGKNLSNFQFFQLKN